MIQVKDKKDCCGCAACAQKCPKQCIVMAEDDEGFLYPKINKEQCNNCGICDKTCPIQNVLEKFEPIMVLAAYNKDERVRSESSSGGVFSLLAEKVINDGGVVFGAKFDKQWAVVLDFTETIEGIDVFKGSKYVQADVRSSYQKCKEFLRTKKSVLFSGTPCQIAGLKKYLGKEYENLITVDVVCHGVPSPMVWRRYLQEIIKNHKGTCMCSNKCSVNPTLIIDDIRFRDKTNGWKNYQIAFSISETADDGRKISNIQTISEGHNDNVYMQAFLSDLILRPSCHSCPFRGKDLRQADISIADYWGVQDLHPEMDDDKGTSLLLLNTKKGQDVFPFNLAVTKVVNLESAVERNGGLRRHFNQNSRRTHFFSAMRWRQNVIFQLTLHTLPTSAYEYNITPFYKKILRKVKWGIIGMQHTIADKIKK